MSKLNMRSLIASLMILLMGQSAFAGVNKLYIEDITWAYNETQKEISILLDNEDEVTVFQFDIAMPAGLTIDQTSVAKVTSRLTGRGATISTNVVDGKLRFVKSGGNPVAPGTGAVITFTAKGTPSETTSYIELSDITISDANAQSVESSKTAQTTVTKTSAPPLPTLGDCIFGATVENFGIAVGKEYTVDITLKNEGVDNLAAFSGTLTLPEGLKIVAGSDGQFIYSDRLPEPLEFQFQKVGADLNFLLSSSDNTLIPGNDGVIFSFVVKADETLASEDNPTATIKFSKLTVGSSAGQKGDCPDFTIGVTNLTIVNNQKAAALNEEIADLQTALNAIEINETEVLAEDFATLTETKAGIQTKIQGLSTWVSEQAAATALTAESTLPENTVKADTEALATALTAAKATKVDSDDFDAYKVEQKDVVAGKAAEGDSEAAQKIVTDAQDAIEALIFDKTKTLEENKAEVDAIVTEVDDALALQRNKDAFADYKAEQVAAVEALAEEGDSEASQKIIADAKAAIEALAYDEEKTLEENEAAVDAVVAPVADALVAQREADYEQLVADNQAAYETLSTQVSALYDKLDEAKANIETYDIESFVNNYLGKLDEIGEQIDAIQEDLDAQLEALTLAGKTTLEEKANIETAIDNLLRDARLEYAILQAQNEGALTKLNRLWDTMSSGWETTKTQLRSADADVVAEYEERIEAIDVMIADCKTSFTEEYEKIALNSNMTLADFGGDEINEAIEAVKTEADFAETQWKNFLNPFMIETVPALQAELKAAEDFVNAMYVKAHFQEALAEIAPMIEEAQAAVQDMYDARDAYSEEGLTQEFVDAQKQAVLDAIAAVKDDAQTAENINKATYDAINAAIADIQTAYDALNVKFAADYKDVADQFTEQMATVAAGITTLTATNKATYEAGNLTEDINIEEEKAEALATLAAIEADAAAKQKSFEVNAAVETLIAAAEQKLADAKATIAELDVVGDQAIVDELAALDDEIETIKADLEAENQTQALTEDSQADYEARIEAFEASVDELLALATANQAAYEANEAAYTALTAEIADAQAALDEANATIETKPASVKAGFADELADMQATLDDFTTEVEAQYAARELTEDSEIDTESIVARLEEILAEAAAAEGTFAELNTRLDAFEGVAIVGELYTFDRDYFEAELDELKADVAALKAQIAADSEFVANQDDYEDTVANYEQLLQGIQADVTAAVAQLVEDKAGFEDYKTDAKAVADYMTAEEDSEASLALITAAKAAIDAVTFSTDIDLAANEAAVDDILSELAENLEEQRSEDNETAYVALSEELDVLDEAIAEAREALSDNKYALVAAEYLAQLDELQELVDAAREDLEERYANVELTLSSTNIDSITLDEVAAVIAAADAAQTDVAGDIDNDGEITLDDFDSFVDELLTNDDLWDAADDPELYEQYKKYDVNGDGSIDVADAQALINLALGLNIDGTLRHNVRSMTGDASQILSAQMIQMSNGITRYIINLNESSNYASFQMKVTGNVVNMSSENASLRTKETADGYRVLGFAKNNAFNGSELLVIDVKGEAQFSNITLATLNATSVAGMLDDATGIANVTIDESEARYDLSGKKLNKQTTGVNIVRGADGKVRKVMVK